MNESPLRRVLSQLAGRSGAPLSAIQTLEQESGMQLPAQYRQILLQHDGGDVQLGNTELMLWSASYIAQAHNEFEVASALPGALLFASDQNEDAFGFDLRTATGGAIIRVPMIGMGWSQASVAGQSWEDFLANFANASTRQA